MDLREMQDLRECQSLDLIIKSHLDKIETHQKRITKIIKMRSDRQATLTERIEQLPKLKKEISEGEKTFYELSTQITKATNRLAEMTTDQQIKATEKEIAALSPQYEQLEIAILEKMELLEKLEIEIINDQTFLEGSEKSLKEINVEVENDIKTEQKEIEQYQNRINRLLDGCSSTFKKAFIQLNNRYRFKSPVASVENKTCSACRILLNPQHLNNIEKNAGPHFCTNCSRLILPSKAFI